MNGFLEENGLSGSKITRIYPYDWTEGNCELYSLQINGEYVKGDYRYFDILISRILVTAQELKQKLNSLDFTCGHFSASGRHYRGFDYTNVYGTSTYLEMEEKYSYVFDEKYFREEVITKLPDGFSLYERNYIHRDDHATHARGTKCELRRAGKCRRDPE